MAATSGSGRTTRRRQSAAGETPEATSDTPTRTGTAKVLSSIENLEREEFVGMTIAQLRERYGEVLGLARDAHPYVNAERVPNTYRIQAGDEVVFSRPTGSKG